MTLGNRIQEIRLAKGLSQEQFGELLDTTRQTVSKWELDQVVPDVRKIIAISRISGVSLDELLLKATNFETEGVPPSGGMHGKSTAEILETVKLALEYYAEGMRRAEADEDRKNLPDAGGKDAANPQKDSPDLQKICELSKIWEEAAYNFAFWDRTEIDWDAEYRKALERVLATKDIYEYYRELMRFMTLLNDGHTDVSFPNWMYQDPEYRQQRWERLQRILLGGPGYGDGMLQEKMNAAMDHLLLRLRADMPWLPEREYYAFTYFTAGFSNRLVAHLAGLSSANAAAVIKCRMKGEFFKLTSPYKFEYLELLKPHKLSNWQRNAIFARLK